MALNLVSKEEMSTSKFSRQRLDFEGEAACQAEKQEGWEGGQVRLCPDDPGHFGRVLGLSVSLSHSPLRGLLWGASTRWHGRNLLRCGSRTDDLLQARGPGCGAVSLTPLGESTLPLGSITQSLVSWVIVNQFPRDRALRAERLGLQGGGLSPCAALLPAAEHGSSFLPCRNVLLGL